MYEGKNIHYSSADNKLLCSFSGKLCNQRRLNGYGFCVRHILEDQTAPFKRCAYVAKSSNQMCTQAIPKHEERRYCNNHMQVLGMLPKKERKKKEKPIGISSLESRLQLANIGTMKPKFSLSSSKESVASVLKNSISEGDPDDPYAFPDSGPSENKIGGIGDLLAAQSDSVLGKSLQSGTGFVRSASDIGSSSSLGMSGGSTIAKYYPELAEKLEKMRAKPEPKASPKSRTKSSRTMNKLQTKIAQNKITEKLRKSQEQNHTDSNSSPLHLSSPEAGLPMDHSPSPGPAYSPAAPSSLAFSPQTPVSQFPPNLTVTGVERALVNQDIPPLPQIDTSLLATLAAQDNMGFQTASEISANHLISPHTPPRLPPPYPGSSSMLSPASITSSDLPTASPQAHLNSVIGHVQTVHKSLITREGAPGSSSMTSLPFTPPPPPHQPSILSPGSTPNIAPGTSVHSFSSPLLSSSVDQSSEVEVQRENKSLPNHMSALPPSNMDILSMLSRKQLVVDTTSPSHPSTLSSPNTLAAQLSLPPPPPYVSPASTHKLKPSVTNSQVPSTRPKNLNRTHSLSSVPQTKLRKLKGILSEKSALKKFHTESAVKFYSFYAKKKISNHCMVGPYLCSSDEESEDEDVDMLPWQPDIFSASSDDDDGDENDECDTDVPVEMRPTKLSLLKTRLRRQWRQARVASKSNSSIRKHNNQATLSLIRTVRESGACAVRALWQIMHIKKSKKKLKKLHRPKKKICCHKNSPDGPCTSPCLPYTNHCLRHIMYNINQQIFDYCTAKFADNTQCCMPVFDIRHELPLCPVHAAKADNYKKQLELENKKKPRKKSKPPALTRPPRKGKKKKKGRHSRQQITLPPAEHLGLDSTASDVDVLGLDPPSQPEEEIPSTSSAAESTPMTVAPSQPPVVPPKTQALEERKRGPNKQMNIELADTLSPDFDKPFELPLEQGSRLLDESDLQEVVNKMHFDSLDLFDKTADADNEEVDQTTLDTATTKNKVKESLETLLCGAMSEEEFMQLATILAQNLQTDGELGQNAPMAVDTPSSETATTNSLEGSSLMDVRALPSGQIGGMVMGMQQQFIGQGLSTVSVPGSGDMTLSLPSKLGVPHQHSATRASHSQHPATHNIQQRSQAVQLSQTLPQRVQQANVHQVPPNVHILPQQQIKSQLHNSALPNAVHPTAPSLSQNVQNQKQQKRRHGVSLSVSNASTVASTFEQNFGNKLAKAPLSHLSEANILSVVSSVNKTSLSLPHTPSATSSSHSGSIHSQTPDFNLVYGQLEHLAQSQLAASVKNTLGLTHVTQQPQGLSQYTSTVAKTVIRHLPTDSQPLQTTSGTNQASFRNISSLPHPPPPPPAYPSGEASSGLLSTQANSETYRGKESVPLSKSAPAASSISVFPRQGIASTRPQISLASFTTTASPAFTSSSTSAISSSSLSSTSLSLSLPSFAKRAKLTNAPSVILTQKQQQQQILQIKQQLQLSHQQIRPSNQKSNPQATTSLNFGRRSAKNPSTNSKLNFSDPSMQSLSNSQTHQSTRDNAKNALSLASETKLSLSRAQVSGGRIGPGSSELLGIKMQPHSSSSSHAKLKLPPPNVVISEIAGNNRLTLSDNVNNSSGLSLSSSPGLSISQGSSYEASSAKTSPNSVQYTLTSNTSLNSSPIQKTVLSDPLRSNPSPNNASSESIFVLVRHPSPLESVPTTVRHTLPDTFPAQVTLPSSPLALLPQASSSPTTSTSPSSQHQQQQQNILSDTSSVKAQQGVDSSSNPSTSERHSVLSSQLSSPRTSWFSSQSVLGQGHQNGLPFQKNMVSPRTDLNAKLNPVASGLARSKTLNMPESRLSTLTGAAGMPVVCSSTTLPGFGQPLPTTAFKTSGTS